MHLLRPPLTPLERKGAPSPGPLFHGTYHSPMSLCLDICLCVHCLSMTGESQLHEGKDQACLVFPVALRTVFGTQRSLKGFVDLMHK